MEDLEELTERLLPFKLFIDYMLLIHLLNYVLAYKLGLLMPCRSSCWAVRASDDLLLKCTLLKINKSLKREQIITASQ